MKKNAIILLIVVAFVFSCAIPRKTNVFTQEVSQLKKSEKALNFIVVGDWGRFGKYNQKEVADQMGIYADSVLANFVISTGDNFYIKGVRSIRDPKWRKSFENIYTAKSLFVPWYVCFGNHDYMGRVNAQLKYGKRSARWLTTERYYSFEQRIPGSNDSILFVFIDTNPFDGSMNPKTHSDLRKQDTTLQKKWLNETLENSKSKWKIVVGHHPLFTTGARRGHTDDIHGFHSVFEKHKVDAYFAGHDHDLQHQKPPGHTHYFVSGAGSKLRPVSSDPTMTKFAISESGFMLIRLSSDSLNLRVINHLGSELYRFHLEKKK
jgi:tartrate-resistant acid phosphatase type 5